jgi:transcriptional regulator with GAF, ATPase, and Fis domain
LTEPGFELLEKLGRGASSVVWKAQCEGEVVALKIGTDTLRGHLASEAERLILCFSARLPTPIEVGTLPRPLETPDGATLPAGAPYLLLTFSAGRDLTHQPLGSDAVTLARAAGRDVGEALADLHASGFAHGDVKPSNIIASDDDDVRCTLIDLGLSDSAGSRTPVGGTPRYLPPPAADDAAQGDARSRDLWALGVTLIELLVPGARDAPDPLELLPSCPPVFQPILRALTNDNPAERPSAQWVHRHFAGPEFDPVRARARVRRSYLTARMSALLQVAHGARPRITMQGIAGEWISTTTDVLQRIALMRGLKTQQAECEFGSLNEAQQRRWLLQLIGSTLVDFPPLENQTDSELLTRLLELAAVQHPETFTFSAVSRRQSANPRSLPASGIDLALQLAAETPSEEVLEAAERSVFRGEATPNLALVLGRALKRRHAMPRALAVLRHFQDRALRLEEAHTLVRLGELAQAERMLGELLASGDLEPEVRSGALALAARLALTRGNTSEAERLLSGAAPSVRILEARASLSLTRGELEDAKLTLEDALSYPHTAEERARIEALFANWAQQTGDSNQALRRFRRAAEHAARAGSLLEEATYLVGVASTATNAGLLGEAISASERSSLLFELLGHPETAARALLSRASALAAAGAKTEAEEAANAALRMARQAGDRRCQGFAHFVLCDVSVASVGREHIQRAAALLDPPRGDDTLHVEARRHRLGLLDDVARVDNLAREERAPDARLEWWGARAEVALERGNSTRPQEILLQLAGLANATVAVTAQGPAFAYGAQLAAESGDGENARRFAQVGGVALARIREGVPSALKLSFLELPWTKLLNTRAPSDVNPDQLSDIETLIHGLSERGHLGTLLNRILDALVSWTSVERGLLLLTAPGGKLAPRAARNLARADLSGDQLELSMSLARRALQTRECIVAVDAAGELPEIHTSVHALKLRSVLAVPLLARGVVMGVVYLDDRVRRGAFGKQELAWVRLVSTLAALAIAETRDQLLLRRAARRARRAEQRVTQLLAKREAELVVAERELARNRDRSTRYAYDDIIGRSEPVQRMLCLVDRVIPSDIPVLVLGESGSGKELVARAIHFNGPRKSAPFVSENCSAIPETLLESTLFGHVKGAFTGATRHHAGLFEVADKGTLLLDEIADMSLTMQAKLLRVLENGEVRRVGSERSVHVDVRVIAATHKDLEQMVARGTFREDLYYRLNVITVRVPTLRERPEDIPVLVRHFLTKYAAGHGVQISEQASETLRLFTWPGNVRQLENETRRALVLADEEIREEHLSPALRDESGSARSPGANLSLKQSLDALEALLVRRALRETSGNQTRAARALGVSRFGLQKMIRRLAIDIEAEAARRPGAET